MRFKSDVRKEFGNQKTSVETFYVFGSVKTTKKKNPSDVDVLVVIPKVNRKKFQYLLKVLTEIQYRIPYQQAIHAFLLNGDTNELDKKLFRAILEEENNDM